MKKATKTISYQSTNSYETLYELSEDTKNVWITFHGMGYLARYFLRHFQVLDEKDNYLIAPQAPSKYYLDTAFKNVGASWLTREDTVQEVGNVLNYVDKVWETENAGNINNPIIFGFSQGVSIALRWCARQRIPCKKLVLYAGGIPNEFTKNDFAFLSAAGTEVILVYGEDDPFLSPGRIATETEKATALFGPAMTIVSFKGEHELRPEILLEIAK